MLLARHEKAGDTYWVVPGGGVDWGEPLHQALQRELREEACVDIDVGDLLFVSDSIAPDGSRHILNLHFEGSVREGTPRLGEDPRVVELRFIPIGDVTSLTVVPDIRSELVAGLQDGFAHRPAYVGPRWRSLGGRAEQA